MNIYDIAREAGVSISTVSRVLNNKSRVSPKTVEKVRAVMERCNYTPSAVARGLVNKSLRTIGIVTVDIRGIHYASLAYNVLQKLNTLGYNCLFCNAGYEQAEQEQNIANISRNCIDGIIFIGSTFQMPFIQKIIAAYLSVLPVVMINADLDLPNIYSVCCDDKKGAAKATAFLLAHGHKNICYIGRQLVTASGKEKLEGYKEQLKKAGYTAHIYMGDNSIEDGAALVRRALEASDPYTAYIFEHDMQAVGGVNVLTQAGARIPQDVEVISYNNSVLSLATTPQLSSVDNKPYLIGTKAAELLDDVIHGKDVARKVVYGPNLVLRGSTRTE